MSSFKYRALLPSGQVQAGVIQAESIAAAEQAMQERGMEVQLLEPSTFIEAAPSSLLLAINRVSEKELVVLSRMLSVMVSASVPLTDALRDIARQSKNPRLRSILGEIGNEVEGGGKLSDALERHSSVFSGFFVNMVRSGETTGQLSEVLDYLADQQEKDYDLAAKIKGAMIYPAFIVFGMGIVAFIMMTFVVPKLIVVLKEANVALPLSTRMLIAVSGFFEQFWWIVLIAVVFIVLGIRWAISFPSGRRLWDAMLLRLPIFGSLFQQVYVVRFARSFSTLLQGGVDIVSALQVVAGVIGNEVWKQAIYETIQEVNDGNSLTTVFSRHSFVPLMMVQMLEVGESTGKTQDVLKRLSSFFSREIDNLVANLVSLIEPLVLLILGAAVGVMVSAILLPLYSLAAG